MKAVVRMRELRAFSVVLAGIALAHAAACRAEVYPHRGGGDARIRTAVYASDEVYRLHGFVGFQIDLEFAPGERFVGLASGDIEALSFVAAGSHLFLKPRVPAVGTNLTVLTTRRSYEFYYTATAARPDELDPDLVYVVKFEYPAEAASKVRDVHAALERRLDRAPAERPQNRNYWYCGAPELRPVEAWDDGVHTRLRFAAQAELPAIFVSNDDGTESLVNFNVDRGVVVIHRVARRFALRRGALNGCVVNKGYTGSGERLASGTVAPDVERVRKQAVP
ncbi:MAG: TrbG/VirB9 family P-type conjugative transfer protein [Steroidobacteraceae bacterium]